METAQLRAMADANPDVARQIVDLFLSTGWERIEVIRTAVERQDWSAVVSAAHSLKGSAGSVGARALHCLSSELEDAVQTAPGESASLVFEAGEILGAEMARVEREIERLLAGLQRDDTAAAGA